MEFCESSRNYEETIERPVYGYLLHNDEQRFEILEKYPNISAKGLSISISNSWRSLSEEQKNEYAERAKELNWKCLSEYEKNEHLEHVKELAIKLKETHHENSELNVSYYESDYESDEDVSEIGDYNIHTQDSYQYDSNTNSSSISPVNLPEQPSSAFAHYVISCTPKMLQFYPKMNLESIKRVLLNNWSNMSPEQRAPWVSMTESYTRNNENSVSNIEYNNNSEDDSNCSSDYDFDDLLNTEDDSEVGESNQSYLQELIHTYNKHKKSQHIDPTHTPSYFRSEPWIQPSKVDENCIENEELVPTSSVDITQCQSIQKDLSIIEEMVPEHCSLLDTQLDVQSSSQENISADTYDYILSSTKENILTDQTIASKFSEQHNKPLETQFLIKPYDKENDVYVSSPNEKKEDPFSSKLTTPLQPRNVIQNEQNPYKSRNAQQSQQDRRYGLKVPVPCIGACEHYQKAVKFDFKSKYGRQTELNKSINNKWKQMVLSEREMWEDMAKADKERYEKEKEEYLTSQYECFLKSQEGIPLIDF